VPEPYPSGAEYKEIVKKINKVNGHSDILAWVSPPPPKPVSPLPPVEPFNVDEILPAVMAAKAKDVADLLQVPLEFAAVPAVLCAGAAVGRRAVIQPKAKDHSWVEPANLWGGLIAKAGHKKSPVLDQFIKELANIQDGWREEYGEEHKLWEGDYKEWKLKEQAWGQVFKESRRSGKGCNVTKPGDPPEEPLQRRLYTSDATVESLHVLMAANPYGILYDCDELTHLIQQADKKGREGERPFLLSAWSGKKGHIKDRISKDRGLDINTPYCCLSLMGAIQPDLVSETLGDRKDGLVERFQVIAYPDFEPGENFEYVDRAPDLEADENYRGALRKLVCALTPEDPSQPHVLRFYWEAQGKFEDWYVENNQRARGGAPQHMRSILAKYDSLMPRLALVFQLFEWGCAGEGVEIPKEVSLENTERAIRYCTVLESHVNRMLLHRTASPAHDLYEKIKEHKLKETFTLREVYNPEWVGLQDPKSAKAAIKELEAAHVVRPLDSKPGGQGGRPPELYQVNPLIWKKPLRSERAKLAKPPISAEVSSSASSASEFLSNQEKRGAVQGGLPLPSGSKTSTDDYPD
jgi:hypothetical protein